eukprot:7072827-Prorocentrum_lima.AAC.1
MMLVAAAGRPWHACRSGRLSKQAVRTNSSASDSIVPLRPMGSQLVRGLVKSGGRLLLTRGSTGWRSLP